MNNIIFRQLCKHDKHEYLNLMYEFTNYKFNNELYDDIIDAKNIKIIVVVIDDKIIGAGTIFKLDKLHNNPVGLVEDVIITNKYRSCGIGKKLIEYLKDIGINQMKCYKIILNCVNSNVDFYKKCGFEHVGCQMKYNT